MFVCMCECVCVRACVILAIYNGQNIVYGAMWANKKGDFIPGRVDGLPVS